MNITSLKQGMLIRDMNRVLEVVKVDEEFARAVVVLDGDHPPREPSTISYTPDGVWSFVSSPTDRQLSILATMNGDSDTAWADTVAVCDTAWADAIAAINRSRDMKPEPVVRTTTKWEDYEAKNLEAMRAELGVEQVNEDPDVLLVGDRVSWKRDNYRVYGLFYRQVRGYCICVTLGTKKRVALRSGELKKECG